MSAGCEAPPLCSAPSVKGGTKPCMRDAGFVVNPDSNDAQHLCLDHYQRFLDYWADSPDDERRPPVKVI